ncbi:hypothetical protein K413DRAFT_0419 [Clostridium sp. ASBs410]|nr:hypothetical protein K413DRAFT_0419 [Clostridium sp. ASBs410]
MDMWIKGLTKHGENRLQLTDKKQSRYQILENNFSTLLKAVSYPHAHNADDGFLPASKPDKGQPSLDPTTKPMNLWLGIHPHASLTR